MFSEELSPDAVTVDNYAEEVIVPADPASVEEESHIVLGYN
ncbi:MAG TPA: hypothetical protein VFG87_17975 [Amycolatopsis sp.]|nr:hypothetical protein [Amycolatopsis sp.]